MTCHEGGPRRRLRRRAALRRGEEIAAGALYEFHRHASLFAQGYAGLDDPIVRRKRIGQIAIAANAALATIDDKEALLPLKELHHALILADASVTHPILTNSIVHARRAERRLLGLEGNRRRLRNVIGAFCLATLKTLIDEGMPRAEALGRVARHAGVKASVLEDWRKRLRRDNAPFRPMPMERHRQRLSFRVRMCLDLAEREGLSGEAMLKYLKTEPALVRRL